MEVIILENADSVAHLGACRISELVNKKPNAVLGLATGTTTILMYQYLVQHYKQNQVSFRDVVTFNLDEYVGINANDPQSYRSFMNREFFDQIDIDIANTHLPSCEIGENPREKGLAYEQAIADSGGIDLQVLGIGSNGHIGFNEPCSSLASRTRVKTLAETTVRDNSRLFKSGEYQPHLAMTMGIATILDSRWTLLLATGERKALAVRNAIEGPLSASCQASALQLHERATFILDEEAASMLENKSYYKWAQKENQPLIEQFGNFYEIPD